MNNQCKHSTKLTVQCIKCGRYPYDQQTGEGNAPRGHEKGCIGNQDYRDCTCEGNAPRSASETLETLKNQIAWLEYVPESEFTIDETAVLIVATERLTKVIKKLNRKYIDQ